MEKKLKILAMISIVTSTIGTILLFCGIFSAAWIKGDLHTTVTNVTNRNSTNTSGSCLEGLFLKCCSDEVYTPHNSSSGFGYHNTSEHSCYVRHKDDFHGQLFAAYQTAQALAALSVICTFLGMVLSLLFPLIRKLQKTPLVPLAEMILFYVAVLLLIIVLIVVGAEFKKFTDMLQPTIGSSLYITVAAAVVVLVAGIISTFAFKLVRRGTDVPYSVMF